MANTYLRALKIATDRYGAPPPADAFRLRDDGDGAYIAAWDEKALGPTPTDDEIAAVNPWDAERLIPKWLDTREIIRRMTGLELRSLDRFGLLSDHPAAPEVYKLMVTLRTGGPVDVHSDELAAGVAVIALVGVGAGAWPDQATAEARIAAVLS